MGSRVRDVRERGALVVSVVLGVVLSVGCASSPAARAPAAVGASDAVGRRGVIASPVAHLEAPPVVTNANREAAAIQSAPSPETEASGKRAPDEGTLEPLPEPTYAASASDTTPAQSPASRFASLQPWECRALLRQHHIATKSPGRGASGVATPLRLAGELGGIQVIAPGTKSVYGILDCRLALLLNDLVPTLKEHGVTALFVDNFYRPGAHLPGKRERSQHAYGLAMDLYGFKLTDGTVLVVERDFQGVLGGPVCGPNAAFAQQTRASVLLRNLVCDLWRKRAFTYLLTPNHDVPHRNHVHADIKRGSRDSLVR